MATSPVPTSTTDILPVLRAALKTRPRVNRVVVNREGKVCYLSVDVCGRRVLAAAVYLEARVVMPLAGTAAGDDLAKLLNDAVCSAATGLELTLLHGVDVNAWNWGIPDEGRLIQERELTAASTPLELAQVQRMLAEQAGTRLPTGVALLTGAPLQRRTLDYPLSDAKSCERQRLQKIVGRADMLKYRIRETERQIEHQNERIVLAEERIVEATANIAALNAESAQWTAELAALDTPEAVREQLEAAALLRGEAGPAS